MSKITFLFVSVVSMLILAVAAGFGNLAANASQTMDGEQLLLAQAKKATGDKSNESAMHNKQGNDLAMQGKYDEAIPHFSEAIKIDPKNVEAYNNRGVAYSKTGKYEKAISDYTKAIDLDPEFKQAYHNRSVAYFHTRDYAQSCSDLNRFKQFGGTPSSEFVKDLERAAGGKGAC